LGELDFAGNSFSKAKGLMLKKDFKRCFVMTYDCEEYSGIWTAFMRFPIDIIFLNSNKTVTDIFVNIKPFGFNRKTWKIYRPRMPSKYIIETRSGIIHDSKTEIGDTFSFE